MASGKGRRRPADWHPLAAKDPIPGDPEDIRDEVRKMKDTASTLRDQARILRKVADGDALKGKYADKIREKSGDLEKHFRETAARYERVVGDLGNWANDLEGFQERADGILKAAKQADEHHAAEVKKKEAEAKRDGKEEGDKEQSEESDPDSHLAPYHKQLGEVISDRDSRAEHYANNIGGDIRDVIKDSGWEDFKDWVHANSKAIDKWCDWLGKACFVIGILVLAFSPVGWVAALATAVTAVFSAASLVGHLALATSGEGSWTDVAFDAVGLITMGTGAIAAKGLANAQKAARGFTAASNRGREGLRNYKNLRTLADRTIARHGPDSRQGQIALRAKAKIRENVAGDMRSARAADNARPATDPISEADPKLAKSVGGDPESAATYQDVLRMKEANPGSAGLDRAAIKATDDFQTLKRSWQISTGVDATDRAIDHTPGLKEPYGDLKDYPTLEVGSRW
ncbi:putative T7SS-secreted protein [Streptomyces olivaceiscleroticus]|uniref:Putative T7SS secretion signal domain-containing protein n=1 Tax=Streptomyces olivaceiscleroticus TaxID=68245 RepID=A0ABP3JKJ4_9ACTN